MPINNWGQDGWANPTPPNQAYCFEEEDPNIVVLRFQDGAVTKASNCRWWRQQPGDPGGIFYYSTPETPLPVPLYRATSVFSCSPHLPIIGANQDASQGTQEHDWLALTFVSLSYLRGVSIAVLDPENELFVEMRCGEPAKQVIGKNARWVPSLVPSTYKQSSSSSAPTSRGLTGNINVLLGLMALSVEPSGLTAESILRVFHGSHARFSNYEWHHSGDFVACESDIGVSSSFADLYHQVRENMIANGASDTTGRPQGVLVWIGLDPADPFSTGDNIGAFERGQGIFVQN
jgi:hypothetical protein